MTHQFVVPAGIDSAWSLLRDLPRVTRCVPGTSVEVDDGETFRGSIKVRLGPTQVVYRGTGSVERTSLQDRTMVLSLQGKESRGPGKAHGTFALQLEEHGVVTTARVVTDLVVTGRSAWPSRALVEDVAEGLVADFAGALAREVRGDSPRTEEVDAWSGSDAAGMHVGGLGGAARGHVGWIAATALAALGGLLVVAARRWRR